MMTDTCPAAAGLRDSLSYDVSESAGQPSTTYMLLCHLAIACQSCCAVAAQKRKQAVQAAGAADAAYKAVLEIIRIIR